MTEIKIHSPDTSYSIHYNRASQTSMSIINHLGILFKCRLHSKSEVGHMLLVMLQYRKNTNRTYSSHFIIMQSTLTPYNHSPSSPFNYSLCYICITVLYLSFKYQKTVPSTGVLKLYLILHRKWLTVSSDSMTYQNVYRHLSPFSPTIVTVNTYMFKS